ncbi:tRNA (N6-threonylcarbamoyladenosine(37)-N6)-methyltransferase TrmO [Prevotella nigrescens]|uniref:tRNA (N6-threonylcarbamoyladenosine(37)-N6)-methyltransferase TrmO n=1 Tax=Prevotella nigrescens TaxID=28133 RepID=UPI0028E2D913|nr:tRNA (N6-threonylcarbamoyladenosine(37)-N6)-methyltransferase TrmO [Prevotella nigrescens]
MKEIEPIAYFRSPFTTKFGIPRQSGLVSELRGRIVFEPKFSSEDALRGLEGFDYVWLIWGFSANELVGGKKWNEDDSLMVRPPRLGGNERVGVFASRSPFRPNGLGLSSVRIVNIGKDGVIEVSGADLMDGTPIYDVKPYLPYADAHIEARGGYTDSSIWQSLDVELPDNIGDFFNQNEIKALSEVLAQDPRPHYQHDANRVYGMAFGNKDVRFRVENGRCIVLEVIV